MKLKSSRGRNFQCDDCKRVLGHKDMYDHNICFDCYDKVKKDVKK